MNYLTKLSKISGFLLSLMYSPIIFLSSQGFSRSQMATSRESSGLANSPCSCKKAIPFFGFWLKYSVPVCRSYVNKRKFGMLSAWKNMLVEISLLQKQL